MWIGDPTVIAELLGHVEDVVHLHNAEVWVEPLQAGQIGEDITAPADIAFAGAELPAAGGGTVALVVGGNVVDAAVWPAAKLPNAIGNFDRKTVVQVAGHHEDLFAELLPFSDHALALIKEAGPRFFFVFRIQLCTAGAGVRDHEGNRGDDKEEIGVALSHRFQQPFALIDANHRYTWLVAMV